MYDAPSDNLECVQECLVSTDGQTSDPRASLAAAIEAVSAAGTLEAMLDGVLAAAVAGLAPSMGAIFVSDPDRPGLQLVASHGMDQDATTALSSAVNDPADPFTTAAVTRIATFDRVETLVLTAILFWVIQSFVAQPFQVRQQSMMDTIQDSQFGARRSPDPAVRWVPPRRHRRLHPAGGHRRIRRSATRSSSA